MDFNFTSNGIDLIATDAGWDKNGERVWAIVNSDDEFVADVTVRPFDNISNVIEKWVEMEACYA